MQNYLLLGAGFSRNWGGWVASEAFEYLLGCPEIIGDARLHDLLWKHQLEGGFEDALAELQDGNISYAHPSWDHAQLIQFQNAVGRMFDDMNRGFYDRDSLEFPPMDSDRLVSKFLTRFDAIFTLNQDLLLEHFYLVNNVVRHMARPHVPGMRWTINPEPIYSESLARATWTPRALEEFRLQNNSQPFVKLHGSSNWFTKDGTQRLLVMGGAKQQEIGRHPLLKWYATQFAQMLCEPNTRLMVIGYGFRDLHVNGAIDEAVKRGLKMFIIDPAGAELALRQNKTRQRGQIPAQTGLERMLQDSLIGGSRRPLREIFGSDGAEFNKVMRFFESR